MTWPNRSGFKLIVPIGLTGGPNLLSKNQNQPQLAFICSTAPQTIDYHYETQCFSLNFVDGSADNLVESGLELYGCYRS